MAQQKGVSRVPVLQTRIGHLEFPKKAPLLPETAKLCERDVGKRVTVGGEEGILRFVGNVHYADGVWCKVEFLRKDIKESINSIGHQYYECSNAFGFIVPESKVKLVRNNAEDPTSGPYSTLFTLQNDHSDKSEPRLFPKLSLEDKDESLGILTPEQMGHYAELNSPNLVDNTVNDLSLGILDESLLSNCALKSLESVELSLYVDMKTYTRSDQTPSPEELPLDPTPILMVDSKSHNNNNNTNSNNSFVTSITSITSLDIGYQGDGEMSRPASRGADNSPLTRRPIPRPQPRRQDPMTDSDFYTESDVDIHEEHPLRGDRRAQVIDGTLYGMDPQEAADVYVNNRENMDSSGIFTDIESSAARPVDATETTVSPSESSTQTPTENSQNLVHAKSNDTIVSTATSKDLTSVSSSTTVTTARMLPKSDSKKYKFPNRNQPSKIKAMLLDSGLKSSPKTNAKTSAKTSAKTNAKSNVKSNVKLVVKSSPMASAVSGAKPKKMPGRWDAVMNKISKGSTSNLKDVKSKVACTNNAGALSRPDSAKKHSEQKATINKLRRVRTRNASSSTKTSVDSSLSDVSGGSPAKKIASSKKREIGVTQVLTSNKLARNQNTNGEAKKIARTPISTPTNQTKILNDKKSAKEKETRIKDCSRVTVKGGRVSPGTRPPQQQQQQQLQQQQQQQQQHLHQQQLILNKAPPRTTEALAVLIHHLVFNLEAFQVPALKIELDRCRASIDEARLTCQQLEESLNEERSKCVHLMDEERARCRAEIVQITEQHHQTALQMQEQHEETEAFLKEENSKLINSHQMELHNVKLELDKLQKTHEETINILHEENCAIREEMDDNNAKIKHLRTENDRYKKECEARELFFKEHLHDAEEEIKRLKMENERFYGEKCEDYNSLQEIQSLRAVLELKQADVANLRTCLAEATQKAEILPAVQEKVLALNSRCEDLQVQLKRKTDIEQQIREEKAKIEEILKEEINQKNRLHRLNEELQYKCKQLTEVLNKVVEQKQEDVSFQRSSLSMSYNEHHNLLKPRFQRAFSLREGNYSNNYHSATGDDSDIDSRPSSPKVKGVVKKCDSVCYVLEMDENPDIIASRIVRRSFRNSINTKNNKTPSNKRPRMKMNSTSSAGDGLELIEDWDTSSQTLEPMSASSPTHKIDIDEHHDLEIELPSLPSEMGNKDELQLLPEPKHLAAENGTSESNSEDESSSTGNL